jgi:hypothetical protein
VFAGAPQEVSSWLRCKFLGLLGHATVMPKARMSIVATSDATKFTNDRSGHGMSVSDQSVTPF